MEETWWGMVRRRTGLVHVQSLVNRAKWRLWLWTGRAYRDELGCIHEKRQNG